MIDFPEISSIITRDRSEFCEATLSLPHPCPLHFITSQAADSPSMERGAYPEEVSGLSFCTSLKKFL